MIVKNEAHVIADCLRSVRPLIDYVLIEDTGSSDGTQDLVRDWLASERMPGQVVDRPWQDFATNRNSALELLRTVTEVDYGFVMDADDALVLPPGFDAQAFRDGLTQDHYLVSIRSGQHSYERIQVVSNRKPYRYRGVLHEFIEAPPDTTQGTIPDIYIRHGIHGARSRNPNKYRDDALLLESALAGESDPFLVARYTFYLGQSWRDAGGWKDALAAYLRRAELGFWADEVFISLLNAARMKEKLGEPVDEVIETYIRAHRICPHRAEALHGIAQYCRVHGLNQRGYSLVADHDLGSLQPSGLFVETPIYEYALSDEHSINAYWSSHYREALRLCCALLGSPNVPAEQRPRIADNARYALDKLPTGGGIPEIRLWPSGPGVRPLPKPAIVASAVVAGKVSIITPTHNRGRFLKMARHYVLSQQHVDVEWLILDDGTDPAAHHAELTGPGIHYLRSETRLSIGEKRNRLIDRAQGEFIVQFDDDDYYAPDYVRSMLQAMADMRCDLINLRGWFLYDLRSQFFGYWDLLHKEGPHFRCDRDGVTLVTCDEALQRALGDNHLGYGFSYVFRRAVWQSVKFPHVDWNEDGQFSIEASRQFRVNGFHDRSGLCLHFLHPSSTARCFPQYQIPNFVAERIFPILGGRSGV